MKTNPDLKINGNIVPSVKRQKLHPKPSVNICSTKLCKSKPKETVTKEENFKMDILGKVNEENRVDIGSTVKNIEPLEIPNDFPNLAEKMSRLSNNIKMIQILQSQNLRPLGKANNLTDLENTAQSSVSNIHGVKSLETLNGLERPRVLQSKSWHNFSESGLHSQKRKVPSDFTHSPGKVVIIILIL